MRAIVATLVLIMTLMGCATPAKMNSLSVGMTKPEVIAAMGKPDSSSADASGETLIYMLTSDGGAWYHSYFVKFAGGKVESFGKEGNEAQKVEVDATVKQR